MLKRAPKYVKNLLCNLWWIISAIAFFYIEKQDTSFFYQSLVLAVVVLAGVAAVKGNIAVQVFQIEKKYYILAALSTLGVILFAIRHLEASIWIAVIASVFVFSLLVFIYQRIAQIVLELLKSVGKRERIVIGGIFLVYCMCIIFAYWKSNVFYLAGVDTIFTADSRVIFFDNAYLAVSHVENDLRQPLFAIAATPFYGLTYGISYLLPMFPNASVYFTGIMNAIILMIIHLLLSRVLKLDEERRIVFHMLVGLAYPSILFSLVMEQYLIAVLWIAGYIYILTEKNKKNDTVLILTSGSMLTSASLVFFEEENKKKTLGKRLLSIVTVGCKGVLMLIVFCRADVIFSIFEKINSLKRFSGVNVPLSNKIYQFFYFVRTCFIAPHAIEKWDYAERPTWQLPQITSFSILGVSIFVIAFIGFWINRKELISKICAFWLIYSVLILVILGWGTAENGLVLYTLYFGWAYWILIYKFINSIFSKIENAKIRYLAWGILIVALAVVNGKGLLELLIFARGYYPA